MKIPLSYSVRSLMQRKVSTALTVSSFALVVFALVALLSMVESVDARLIASGSPDRLLVIDERVTSENHSRLTQETVRLASAHRAIRMDEIGRPYASPEIVKTAFATSAYGDRVQVNFRAVDLEKALQVHHNVTLIAGQYFKNNSEDEVILGKEVFEGLGVSLGDRFQVQRTSWRVVGVFEDAGSISESEIWSSIPGLARAFNKFSISSLWLRVDDPSQTDSVIQALNASEELSVFATTERDYYAQGAKTAEGLQILAWFIATIMAIGAVFSAINSLYASIAHRAGELATMRAIGFDTRSVMMAVLFEGLIIAVLGGALACLSAMIFNGATIRTPVPGVGMAAFSFFVTPGLLVLASGFSLLLGLVGGWLPARRATRMNIIEALHS